MAVMWARYRASRSVLRLHDLGQFLSDPWKMTGISGHHAQEPEIVRIPVQLKNQLRDQTEHVLGVALGFDARRKGFLVLSRQPAKHLPEDLLLAGELIVERPPGEARRLSQLVHAHRAKPMSRKRRVAASTIASRDPPRATFAAVPFDFF